MTVGHIVILKPPNDPQPFTAFGLVAYAVVNVDVTFTPFIVATEGAVQVLAEIAAVGRAMTMLGTPQATAFVHIDDPPTVPVAATKVVTTAELGFVAPSAPLNEAAATKPFILIGPPKVKL